MKNNQLFRKTPTLDLFSRLTKIFGFPSSVYGCVKKTIEIEGAESIDDTYVGVLDYNSFILTLTIDVTSRVATRKMFINGSNCQLLWDWNNNFISVYTPARGWNNLEFEMLAAEEGYNKNITEQMYIDEMASFISAINKESKFPNTLEHDKAVLNLLYSVEKSDLNNKIISL